MVIHSKDLDTRVQARNRIRNDLNIQYLLADSNEIVHLSVPIEFLNTPLTVDKKKALCNILVFRNEKGERVGWTTTKRKLIELGYNIKECKRMIGGKRTCCTVITRED